MINKRKLSISIDRIINDILEEKKINKSKLINFLINKCIENKEDIRKFKKLNGE